MVVRALLGLGGLKRANSSLVQSFPQGNTIGTTLFGILGGILIAISLPNLPWAGSRPPAHPPPPPPPPEQPCSPRPLPGIETAYLTSASNVLIGLNNLEQAIGMVVLVAFVIVFLLVIASARTSIPICFAILLIALSLIL